jgi:hypothetical protein
LLNRKARVEADGDAQFRSFLWDNLDNPFLPNATLPPSNAPLDLVSFYEQVWNHGYPMNQLFSIQLTMNFYNSTRNTLMLGPPTFSIPSRYLVSSGNSSKARQKNLLLLIAKTFRLLGQNEKAAESDALDLLDFERQLALVRILF